MIDSGPFVALGVVIFVIAFSLGGLTCDSSRSSTCRDFCSPKELKEASPIYGCRCEP
jgi:hypothetical protein